MSPLVVVVGETASGKSSLGMALAQRFNGEIICADSWTVYKEFDIGTAKPTIQDQELVRHHLLDVADPRAGFNAALFQRLAKNAIADISARRKLPIMVGGTGLYIDSVLYDYSFLPPSDPALRRELNLMTLDQLLNRVSELEIDTTGIDLRNKRRIIRLIENDGVRPIKGVIRPNTLILGINRSINELRERIVKRLENMIENGFANEVSYLGMKYGWDCEPMRAPDYRVFADYVLGRVPLEVAKDRVRQNDLQLAKKQRTWFKRNDSIHWVNDRSYAEELLTTFLNKTP